MSVENPNVINQLLKNKYNLHKIPETEAAARRTAGRTGEKIAQDPFARIQNYLDRFKEITDRKDPKAREHGLDAGKRFLHRKYVIKPDDIPESYWENQRRIIRERGQGADLEYVDWEELKRQNTEAIIADQKSSLDKWVNYLSSSDALCSDALKYWTLRSVLNMAEYDKEKGVYPQRSKGTTKPFPDLNREALAYVLDAIEKKYRGYDIDVSQLNEENAREFKKLLDSENFSRLYTWAIEKVTPASPEDLAFAKGEWIKYDKGLDHMPLVKSLQGHGTGWCTAGESTARIQLQTGDFYVYYSFDRSGNPTIPRAAIRMEENRIAEIRGIASEQNLDAGVVEIVEKKLEEFPDGSSYRKKVEDMRRLTAIEHKIQGGENLTSGELSFLYEIDAPIEGFGYETDPRIEELRGNRNPKEDMLVIFNCESSQIAHKKKDINKDTKVYVGELEPGIFSVFKKFNIEHVYTSFPEGKVHFDTVNIGGKTSQELLTELKASGVNITPYAQDMMESRDFITLKNSEPIELVRLKVRDLDFVQGSTTDQIFQRVHELGLELAPAEVGPHLVIALNSKPTYKDLSIKLPMWIGMKQITDRSGRPRVFLLGRDGGGLWLHGAWALPEDRWDPGRGFVLCLRKPGEATSDVAKPGSSPLNL